MRSLASGNLGAENIPQRGQGYEIATKEGTHEETKENMKGETIVIRKKKGKGGVKPRKKTEPHSQKMRNGDMTLCVTSI